MNRFVKSGGGNMFALKQPANAAAADATRKPAHPARPIKGREDYAALRRELKSKFPKTIARLAG
jgi:hypothetical protein